VNYIAVVRVLSLVDISVLQHQGQQFVIGDEGDIDDLLVGCQ
jgi:hypothetical protein